MRVSMASARLFEAGGDALENLCDARRGAGRGGGHGDQGSGVR